MLVFCCEAGALDAAFSARTATIRQMEADYTWRMVRRGVRRGQRRRGGAGIWVATAVAMAVLIHLLFLIAADRWTFQLGGEGDVIVTDWVNLQRVEVEDPTPLVDALPEKDEVIIPPDNAAELADELAMLEVLPDDLEIDIRPDVEDPSLSLKLENPALRGDENSDVIDPVAGPELNLEIDETGNIESLLKDSQNGRIVVDPGAADVDKFDPDEVTRDLARRGLDSLSEEGVPEGYTSLEALLKLDGNSLGEEKGMIGSDLLFEFNSAELRQSARISLMKVGMLIEKNPEMYCWIEGHSDLFGADDYNARLSRQRAEAVRKWLVTALGLNDQRIFVVGKGKVSPLVASGDKAAQALNRRVEIKMRKAPPVAELVDEAALTPAVEPEPDPFEGAPQAEVVDEASLGIPAESVVIPAEPVELPLVPEE